jgi:hypothetical protein
VAQRRHTVQEHRPERTHVPEDLGLDALVGDLGDAGRDALEVVGPRRPVRREEVLHDDQVELGLFAGVIDRDRVDPKDLCTRSSFDTLESHSERTFAIRLGLASLCSRKCLK